MSTADLRSTLAALGQNASARDRATASRRLTEAHGLTHPFVAADLAAAKLHANLFLAEETLTERTPLTPTRLTYPVPGLALLSRGERAVSLRHHLGDWRFFLGFRVASTQALTEVLVDARQPSLDLDAIAAGMARFLTGEAEQPW
ncbi:MAG: hypothetical protein JNK72_24715 [Myxococcales bacterium]|nr:hypothetical protein [Myxococcales bacterium]